MRKGAERYVVEVGDTTCPVYGNDDEDRDEAGP